MTKGETAHRSTNLGIQAAAWTVLLSALAVCGIIAVGVPWLGGGWAQAATAQEHATVERRDGSVTLSYAGRTVLLEPSGLQTAQVPEGTEISTLADGRAHVRLFDESTVNLEPGTQLRLEQARRARFPFGDAQPRIVLDARPEGEEPARLTVGTTWHATQFDILTGDAVVSIAPESHARLTVGSDETHVHALDGRVAVVAGGVGVQLLPDTVTEVAAGGRPHAPRPALANVIADGDFRRPVAISWFPRAEGEPPGSAEATTDDGRTVLEMRRIESQGHPGDIVLEQTLGSHDMTGASYLGMTVTLKIGSQSLAGGGERDIEYPLMTKLVLERQDGSEDVPWEIGFYAREPGQAPSPSELGVIGIPVPRDTWVTFGTGNLLDPTATPILLGPDGELLASPDFDAAANEVERFAAIPRRLLRFELKGSGHDWSTEVDHVGLWAK